MSYCRWSTDDFQCDLYVYASCYGGWEINVAGNRVIYKSPLPEKVPLDMGNFDAWLARDQRIHQMLEEAERVPIGLPHDGDTFSGDRDSTVETLKMLRDCGYRFPVEIIDAIASEPENDPENSNPPQEPQP